MSFSQHANSNFCQVSTQLQSQWVSLHLQPPTAKFVSCWEHAKFDFEFSIQESKGPLGNGALSLHGKRKIRVNQLLPLYSISHLSLLLDTLCCLPRGAIHQNLGKMTRGRKQCQYTKSMGKTPAYCQVKYNRKWFCLVFNRIQKKNKTMMKLTIVSHYALCV